MGVLMDISNAYSSSVSSGATDWTLALSESQQAWKALCDEAHFEKILAQLDKLSIAKPLAQPVAEPLETQPVAEPLAIKKKTLKPVPKKSSQRHTDIFSKRG